LRARAGAVAVTIECPAAPPGAYRKASAFARAGEEVMRGAGPPTR
jgi:hypothetical protein